MQHLLAVLVISCKNQTSSSFGKVTPTYRPGVKFVNPREYLPEFMVQTLKDGILEMGKKIAGFDDSEAILTGVENKKFVASSNFEK